jgi:hypothetical protein
MSRLVRILCWGAATWDGKVSVAPFVAVVADRTDMSAAVEAGDGLDP